MKIQFNPCKIRINELDFFSANFLMYIKEINPNTGVDWAQPPP